MGKFTIKPFSLITICFVSFFRRFEATKIFAFAVMLYMCRPFSRFFQKRHAFVSGSVCTRHFFVKAVCLLRAFSQVKCLVVGPVTVNMINILGGPLPCDKEPSNPVGVVKPIIYAYSDISIWVNAPSSVSSLTLSAPISFPCKISSIWAIIKKFKNSGSSLFVFHENIMSSLKTFVNRRVPSLT